MGQTYERMEWRVKLTDIALQNFNVVPSAFITNWKRSVMEEQKLFIGKVLALDGEVLAKDGELLVSGW